MELSYEVPCFESYVGKCVYNINSRSARSPQSSDIQYNAARTLAYMLHSFFFIVLNGIRHFPGLVHRLRKI